MSEMSMGKLPAGVFPSAWVLARTQGMERETWLDLRRRGIGGSDAAAIVGLNPWSSPYEVWSDKCGLLPPKEETEAMRLGNALEEYVAKRFAEETGKRVRRYPYMLCSERYPWALADIDRRIVGENAGLECKTTRIHGTGKRGYPDYYYCQCQHYMATVGADRWYLAIINMADSTFTWHVIERSDEDIAVLMAAEDLMMQRVRQKSPPPMDGSDATTDALGSIYSDARPGMRISLAHRAPSIDEIVALRADKKAIEQREKQLIQEIKLDMRDAEEAEIGSRARVTWKAQERRSIDIDAMIRAGIDVSPYISVSKTRTFKIVERS